MKVSNTLTYCDTESIILNVHYNNIYNDFSYNGIMALLETLNTLIISEFTYE
jgi:hypothetical protein